MCKFISLRIALPKTVSNFYETAIIEIIRRHFTIEFFFFELASHRAVELRRTTLSFLNGLSCSLKMVIYSMGNEARHGRLVLSCFVCNILAQIFWHVKEAHRDCLIGNLCCRWGSAQITKIMMKTHSNLFLAIFLSCPFGDSNLRPRDSMSKQLQQMLQLNLFLFTHSFYQLIVESLKQLIGRFNVTSKMTDFYFSMKI